MCTRRAPWSEPAPQENGVDVEQVGCHDGGGLGFERRAGQEWFVRWGARSIPAFFSISQMVEAPILRPRLSSPPWIRRYPRPGFSRARRRTSFRSASGFGGRPGRRCGQVRFRATRSDQQHQLCTLLLVHRPEQRCHDSPIAPGKLRSWLGALRDSELVPERQDLDVLRRTRPGQQREPSEELTRELIDQTYRHDPV